LCLEKQGSGETNISQGALLTVGVDDEDRGSLDAGSRVEPSLSLVSGTRARGTGQLLACSRVVPDPTNFINAKLQRVRAGGRGVTRHLLTAAKLSTSSLRRR